MTSGGVEQQFRAIFAACYGPLVAYALRRCGDRAAAEDIAADTFLVAWRRIGDVPERPEEAVLWLYAVARRVSANRRRGDARRERLIARLRRTRVDHAEEAPTDDALTANGAHAIATSVFRRLRPADVEILQLALWEELPHAQIAVVLGCSVNAVGIRLHRARKAFSVELEKDRHRPGHLEATGHLPFPSDFTND